MQINQAKRDYKAEVEQLLKANDAREAWHEIKIMVGLNSQWANSAQTVEFANDFNCFFARYETDRPSQFKPKGDWREDGTPIRVTSEEVRRTLSQINTRKSIGPERIVLSHLKSETNGQMDALQFEYRAKEGVEDATVTLLNQVYKHLETPSSYVRILFADFSSAFNTVQADLLTVKPGSMGVHHTLIRWRYNFLTERQQYVHVHGGQSSVISTGVPQGCVLSPMLFTLYTNDCVSHQDNCTMIKYADDAALIGLLTDDETRYRAEINHFYNWCSNNSLILNRKKTEEMIIDFRKNSSLSPVIMNDTTIESIQEYKYLGTITDSKLTWNANTNARFAKAQ